jgi:hypothetical protein
MSYAPRWVKRPYEIGEEISREGFSLRGLARWGRLGGLSLPIGEEWGRVFFSGFLPADF